MDFKYLNFPSLPHRSRVIPGNSLILRKISNVDILIDQDSKVMTRAFLTLCIFNYFAVGRQRPSRHQNYANRSVYSQCKNFDI